MGIFFLFLDLAGLSASMSNARPSVPTVTKVDSLLASAASAAAANDKSKTMTHHLDLVRSGVASIEDELQQRASLLAVDNANLRTILEQTNGELQMLRGRMAEFESTQRKLMQMQKQVRFLPFPVPIYLLIILFFSSLEPTRKTRI